MSDPISSLATYFSVAKLWTITASVCGSVIPILALADKTRIRLLNAMFMAITGASFAIFVGPYLAQKLDLTSLEGVVALSWIMGATGVFVVRVVFKWLERRGVSALDTIFNKVTGTSSPTETPTSDLSLVRQGDESNNNERKEDGIAG